jgi:NAD(P)-dependent dehydrogenase (short-subunit alcohol dehydrogenase family)
VQEAQLGQPEGVARVLAWLVSDEAEYVKGMISTR